MLFRFSILLLALVVVFPAIAAERINVAPDAYGQDLLSESSEILPTNLGNAAELFESAKHAAELGRAAEAMQLATDAVFQDPDCAPARHALGYEQYEGVWLTPYQLRMAKRGQRWNSDYGWIKPDDLSRYEAGERTLRGRWVSAEVDARRHDTIETGWQIRTDHFIVTTNHSLEAGARLAAKLEEFYQVWNQLFADFYLDDDDLRARFSEGRAPGVQSRPFRVNYHRTQDEYNTALESRQPRIAETIGIYFDRQRQAHFFHPGEVASATGPSGADEDFGEATLYHEAAHQLFQESTRGRRESGAENNFWAIEGVATWLESLCRHETTAGVYFTVGEPDAGRLPAARSRLLDEGYRVPLIELVALSKRDLQQRDDLAAIYSQSAGLAAFFLADGERRVPFVEYLRAVYDDRADTGSLADLMGCSFADLDDAYRAFLEGLPADSAPERP